MDSSAALTEENAGTWNESAALPSRIFSIVLNLVVILCVAIRLKIAYSRTVFPFSIDYEEGNVLNAAVRLLHHITPYPDPRSFPSILNPYGPVGYALTAAAMKVFGNSFFGPRLLVLCGAVGISLLIAGIVKTAGGRWQVGFLLAAVYLSLPIGWTWLPLLRVDFWAILLSLFGLFLFMRFEKLWFLPPIVLGLAFLTKPTAVAAMVACIAELVARKHLKKALGFATIFGACVFGFAFAAGSHFIFDMIRTHPDPYSFGRLARLYIDALQSLLLALVVVIWFVVRGYRWTEQSRCVRLYFALCCVTALTAGKLGSNSNHLLEWAAALCVFSGVVLSDLLERRDRLARAFVVGFGAMIAVYTVLLLFFAPLANPVGCSDAYAFISGFPSERILSEDVGALVLSGKPVWESNPFVVTQLDGSVAWEWGGNEALAQKQYFDLIFLGGQVSAFRPESGRWSPAFIRAVAERYRPERTFKCGVAYVPISK